MTVVEELVSVLGLEIGEGALATLSKFRSAVTQGLAGVGGMVAALGAAFAGTVVSVAELGTEINTTAMRLGVGTDAIQELKYAADITNVSFESLTTAMKFLSKNAAEGGDAAKRVFEAFSGIGMRDAQGNLKTVDVLIEDFADKIAKTKDPIKQVELAMHALHGQSGVQLLPLLKQGKAGIQKLREEAQDLGYVLDKKTIESSARFTVSLKHLKNALLGVRNTVGSPFIDDFSDALDWMTDRVRKARAWFLALTKDIRELGQRFGRLIEVGKKAFAAIGQFVTQLKLDRLADTVKWVDLLEAALIGVATVAVASAAATAASWLLAAAPFIIIATLIGLIVDDIAHFLTGGESVLGMAEKWSKAFNPEDSNLIKFFKRALDLLFDLGDSAKWKRVVDAAKTVFFGGLAEVNGWGNQKAIEADNASTRQRNWAQFNKEHEGQDEKYQAVMKVFEKLQTADPIAQRIKKSEDWNREAKDLGIDEESMRAESQAQSDALPYQQMIRRSRLTKGSDGSQSATDELPFQKKMREQMSVHQEIEVHIHGANDPSDPAWVKKVQDVMDKSHSDAKAAITGGS